MYEQQPQAKANHNPWLKALSAWLADVKLLKLIIWLTVGLVSVSIAVGAFLYYHIFGGLKSEVHGIYRVATNLKGPSDQLNEIYRLTTNSAHQLAQLNVWVNDKYPTNGLVAEFRGRSASEIVTSSDEEISMLSDSAHGGSSVVWYERILHDPSKGRDSDGFLRIHFHLNTNSPVPYAGICAFFANPPRMFDISDFHAVELRARANVTNGGICEYTFHLCDINAANKRNYAWAEIKLPLAAGSGSTNWVPCQKQLQEFTTPDFSTPIPFDQTRVIGFTIQVGAKDGKEAMGYLDLDDIRFRR